MADSAAMTWDGINDGAAEDVLEVEAGELGGDGESWAGAADAEIRAKDRTRRAQRATNNLN